MFLICSWKNDNGSDYQISIKSSDVCLFPRRGDLFNLACGELFNFSLYLFSCLVTSGLELRGTNSKNRRHSGKVWGRKSRETIRGSKKRAMAFCCDHSWSILLHFVWDHNFDVHCHILCPNSIQWGNCVKCLDDDYSWIVGSDCDPVEYWLTVNCTRTAFNVFRPRCI